MVLLAGNKKPTVANSHCQEVWMDCIFTSDSVRGLLLTIFKYCGTLLGKNGGGREGGSRATQVKTVKRQLKTV